MYRFNVGNIVSHIDDVHSQFIVSDRYYENEFGTNMYVLENNGRSMIMYVEETDITLT